MCLYLKKYPSSLNIYSQNEKKEIVFPCIKTAETDIIVYKRFLYYYSSNGLLMTPFMKELYQLDYISKIANFDNKDNFYGFSFHFVGGWITIEAGIHSYTELTHALKARNITDIIYECIIPQGSKYMKSEDDTEIVSNQLKAIKRNN